MLLWIVVSAFGLGAVVALWAAKTSQTRTAIIGEALIGAVLGGIFGAALDHALTRPASGVSAPSSITNPALRPGTQRVESDLGSTRTAGGGLRLVADPGEPLAGVVRECRVDRTLVLCDLLLTSNIEHASRASLFVLSASRIKMWDNHGNEYAADSIKVGKRSDHRRLQAHFLMGIQSEVTVAFSGVPESAREIGLLEFMVYHSSFPREWNLTARQVPMVRLR